MEQDNESVKEFYEKLKKLNELVGYDEEGLFLNGLPSANQIEAEAILCGVKLPLDELVDRLEALEKLTNG